MILSKNELNKLILEFEENGFSSSYSTEDTITLTKEIQKENFKMSIFYILICNQDNYFDINKNNPTEAENSYFRIKGYNIYLDLIINHISVIENAVKFKQTIKCPIVLQLISEFILEIFLQIKNNRIDFYLKDTYHIAIKHPISKKEITLFLCFYENAIQYSFNSGPVIVKHKLEDIEKEDSSVLFEELKDAILEFDTI